jgi:ribonuclease Z
MLNSSKSFVAAVLLQIKQKAIQIENKMGISSLRILSCQAVDSSPCVVLTDSNGRGILVNCGEGCQRSFLEYPGIKLKKIKKICLTRISHTQIGGLPGFILTSSDTSTAEQQLSGQKVQAGIQVIGPLGTLSFIHSLRHFLRREKFPIHVLEGEQSIPLNTTHLCEASTEKRATKRQKQEAVEEDETNDVDFRIQTIPVSYVHENRSASDTPITVSTCSFIFTTPPIPGKFLPDKAKSLGIPPGPLYAKLKAGQPVTFSYYDKDSSTLVEKTVSPEEVLSSLSSQEAQGVAVIILYCPNHTVLEQLMASKHLEVFREVREEKAALLDCIIHIAPRTILDEESYQTFVQSFGSHVQHISMYADEDLLDELSPFISACKGAISRSFLNSMLFPVPFSCYNGKDNDNSCVNKGKSDYSNGLCGELSSSPFTKASDLLGEKLSRYDIKAVRGRPMMEYIIVPRSKKGLDTTKVRQISLGSVSADEYKVLHDFVEVQGALNAVPNLSSGSNISKKREGKLILTGTGSAIPCKHRNVTGMCLHTGASLTNGGCIMLDVGEGTCGQLYRVWGGGEHSAINHQSSFDNYLSNIRAVWISHPHADHHLGLLRLLSERNKCCPNNPITLIAPNPCLKFLDEYGRLDPSILGSYIPFDCRDLLKTRTNISLIQTLQNTLGIKYCYAVPVTHCPHSFAIIIDGTAFGKIVYSGDCRPSDRLCEAGVGADLLIHEATFEVGMEEEASLKKHCTVGEALDVAKKMEAKAVLLTHFSQRYPKIPPLPEQFESSGPEVEDTSQSFHNGALKVIFAFDYMSLAPDDLDLAAELTPALRLLYPGEN